MLHVDALAYASVETTIGQMPTTLLGLHHAFGARARQCAWLIAQCRVCYQSIIKRARSAAARSDVGPYKILMSIFKAKPAKPVVMAMALQAHAESDAHAAHSLYHSHGCATGHFTAVTFYPSQQRHIKHQ
jgi:hypothetical protein